MILREVRSLKRGDAVRIDRSDMVWVLDDHPQDTGAWSHLMLTSGAGREMGLRLLKGDRVELVQAAYERI